MPDPDESPPSSRPIADLDLAALRAVAERDKLHAAIVEHHGQRADDRCHLDDDRLYAAAGLPPADHRVGDKAAMLANCAVFIDRRCEGGGWPSYAELEAERNRLAAQSNALAAANTKAAHDLAVITAERDAAIDGYARLMAGDDYRSDPAWWQLVARQAIGFDPAPTPAPDALNGADPDAR